MTELEQSYERLQKAKDEEIKIEVLVWQLLQTTFNISERTLDDDTEDVIMLAPKEIWN